MTDKVLVIPGIEDRATLACISRARKYSQYKKAVENALLGKCPFCNIDKEYNQIVAENEFWYAWPCKPPEDNTAYHFLFVPKRHVVDSEELSSVEVTALWGREGIRANVRRMYAYRSRGTLMREGIRANVRRMYAYRSRGTLMRDGDATLSAGTIQHLHVHDMVPNGTGRVESPFFKGAESEAEGLERAIVFEKLRNGTLPEELKPEEFELVTGRL